MENTIKERLIEFIRYKKISKRSFLLKVGLSESYINSIRKSIQPDKVYNIAKEFPDLNTGWLMTGEGEMLKSTIPKEISCEETSSRMPNIAYYNVPLLPVMAQGGSLNDFFVQVKDTDCERIISPIKGVDYAISVSGDSMAPEYPSGSKILIKKINERAFIDWGKVYVLDTCNGVVIKKLMPAGESNSVTCVSINPDYPSFVVELKDVFGVYRVLMSMSEK